MLRKCVYAILSCVDCVVKGTASCISKGNGTVRFFSRNIVALACILGVFHPHRYFSHRTYVAAGTQQSDSHKQASLCKRQLPHDTLNVRRLSHTAKTSPANWRSNCRAMGIDSVGATLHTAIMHLVCTYRWKFWREVNTARPRTAEWSSGSRTRRAIARNGRTKRRGIFKCNFRNHGHGKTRFASVAFSLSRWEQR